MENQRPRSDRSLYGREYGEMQGRDVATEYLKILDAKLTGREGKVLELGVGSGSLLPFLESKFGAENVIGLDINGWILRNSEFNKDKNNIEGDIESLPIASNSINRIVSLHTFEHAPDLKAALEEVERILVPGGEAIIVVPKPQFKMRQMGALVDTLRMYAGFDKLLEAWKRAEGIEKFAMVYSQLKKAWDEAGKYHVQNVTPEKIKDAKTGLKIEDEVVFVPLEMGSSFIITLKKGSEEKPVEA